MCDALYSCAIVLWLGLQTEVAQLAKGFMKSAQGDWGKAMMGAMPQ
jgi:hypothetical protein